MCCLNCCRAGDLGDHDYCSPCDRNSHCFSSRDAGQLYQPPKEKMKKTEKPKKASASTPSPQKEKK
ncbi:hypothetical protein BGZ63DRAFT_15215 [Mariannaea sp. PMI_226]|nr:hypothetical protein BGZ63DRAFT_15215 [Mariannaea sp. PMI_226]